MLDINSSASFHPRNADLSDIRIIFVNSGGTEQEIRSQVFANDWWPSGDLNVVYFELQQSIPDGVLDGNYYIYYNNTSASVPAYDTNLSVNYSGSGSNLNQWDVNTSSYGIHVFDGGFKRPGLLDAFGETFSTNGGEMFVVTETLNGVTLSALTDGGNNTDVNTTIDINTSTVAVFKTFNILTNSTDINQFCALWDNAHYIECAVKNASAPDSNYGWLITDSTTTFGSSQNTYPYGVGIYNSTPGLDFDFNGGRAAMYTFDTVNGHSIYSYTDGYNDGNLGGLYSGASITQHHVGQDYSNRDGNYVQTTHKALFGWAGNNYNLSDTNADFYPIYNIWTETYGLTFSADQNVDEFSNLNIEVVYPESGEILNNTITIDFNVIDTDANATDIDFNINLWEGGTETVILSDGNVAKTPVFNCDTNILSLTATTCHYDWDTTSTIDGNYRIKSYADNNLFNRSDLGDANFTIDNTSPFVYWDGNTNIQIADVNFMLFCNDNVSCNSIRFRKDNDNSSINTFPNVFTIYDNNIYISKLASSDRNIAIAFYSTDTAGNDSNTTIDVNIQYIYIDLNGPVGTLKFPEDAGTENAVENNPTFTIKLIDTFSNVKSCRVHYFKNNETQPPYNNFVDSNSDGWCNFNVPTVLGEDNTAFVHWDVFTDAIDNNASVDINSGIYTYNAVGNGGGSPSPNPGGGGGGPPDAIQPSTQSIITSKLANIIFSTTIIDVIANQLKQNALVMTITSLSTQPIPIEITFDNNMSKYFTQTQGVVILQPDTVHQFAYNVLVDENFLNTDGNVLINLNNEQEVLFQKITLKKSVAALSFFEFVLYTAPPGNPLPLIGKELTVGTVLLVAIAVLVLASVFGLSFTKFLRNQQKSVPPFLRGGK